MVTKKIRWLSAIAAVIMLVSMLAGIVVPAGAASGSAILTELQKKYDALQQEDFVGVRDDIIKQMRDEIADLIKDYGETDLDHEREIYENIGVQIDQEFTAANKGKLVEGLIVRYSFKKYYEEMGYSTKATTYYISDVADWTAAATSGSLFIGVTLLVTNDIDFENKKVEQLTVNDAAFQGVLDGQGHRFINMVIDIGDTADEKTYKYGGLVAALTGGTIKNLGLDGGELIFNGEDTVTDRNEGVGSFAGYIGKNGLLQNCWSTMTITNKRFKNSEDEITLDGNKNGVSGLVGWGEGGAIDNCFFAGTVNNNGTKHAATDLIGYTANAVKVYNSIGAGTLNCTSGYNPAALGVNYTMYSDLTRFSLYNTYAVGENKNVVRHRSNYNPYNYKDDGVYVNAVTLSETDITFTKDIVHKFTPEEINVAYKMDTLEEAVWAVNARFDTTHQSADREYIISVDEAGNLYMAKNSSAYRKVIIEGDAIGEYFFKEGTKVHLINDLNLMAAESLTIDKKDFASALDGYELTVPAGDIVITIEYSADSELTLAATELIQKVEKYENLNFDLFDCEQLLKDWMGAAKAELSKSGKDLDMIKRLLDMEGGEDGFANIMALKPGLKISSEQYDLYKNYNRKWYISSVADWQGLTGAANGETFEGDTFYVENDIDFEGQTAEPLTANTTEFQGILDGQGHRFIDMVIEIGDTEEEKSYKFGGLVAALTGGTIKNLGLDGGELNYSGQDVVTDRNEGVGSFAGYIGAGGLLQNCWSTMTVTNNTKKYTVDGKDKTTLTGDKNGVSGLIGWGEGGAIDNCFFTGIVNNEGSGRAATDLVGYTSNKVKVYNSIGAGTLVCDANYNPAAVCVHYSMYADVKNFSIYNTYAVGKNVIRHRGNYDPYNYKDTNYVNYSDTDITFTKDVVHKFTPEETNAAYMIDSLKEAVWAVNNRFDATHQSPDREYIISVDENGELYMAKNEGAYYKVVIMASGKVVETRYVPSGKTITLNVEEAIGYKITEGSSSTIAGNDLTVGNEDVVVEAEVDNTQAILDLIEKVEGLMDQYSAMNWDELANVDKIEAWMVSAQEAIDAKSLDALNLVVKEEAKLKKNLALKEGFYPAFTQYDQYKDLNKTNDWLIASKADWDAMDEYAKAEEGNYFKGFTFHLKNNVDFGGVEMLPLGARDNCYFAGTINGHGYGFENVKIKVVADQLGAIDGKTYSYYTKMKDNVDVGSLCGSAGLIAFLGACTIQDFGVNSGSIEVGTGDGAGSVSTFGCVPANTAETAPTFIRVWSGATIQSTSNAHVNALVGSYNYTNGAVKVNGFLFTGKLTKKAATSNAEKSRDSAYGVYGGAAAGTASDNGEFYNIIISSTVGGKVAASYLFAYSSADAFKTAVESNKVKNVYGLSGIANTYRVKVSNKTNTAGATTFGANNYEMVHTGMLEAEAAWKINSNQVAGQEPVYLTLKNGKLAYGTAENQIRKIVVKEDGKVVETYYKLPNETVTLDASSDYILTEGTLSTLNANVLTVGNEDVVITKVTCAHNDVAYTHNQGTKTHTIHCNSCGKDLIGDCVLGNWVANDDLVIEDGVIKAGTHSASCTVCGGEKVETKNCVGTLIPNAIECTRDGTYTFDCCDRADTLAIGSGKAGHTHNGNWTDKDAPPGKEIDKCQYCEVCLVRSAGKIEVSTGNQVCAGQEVDVVITLPYALTEATIEIAPEVDSKYTIQSIVAENLTMEALPEQNGIYTATLKDVQAGATITVTVKVEQFGFVEDGFLNVDVTNASNAEGAVTDASAIAKITLALLEGDANADGSLNVMDPLAVLQYMVDSTVQIHIPNADLTGDGNVDGQDAVRIIREWMKTL